MTALGVIEMIGADASFASANAEPTPPGAERAAAGAHSGRVARRGEADAVAATVAASIVATVESARARADARRTSTTLAALAHALELAGEPRESAEVAQQALDLCANDSGSELADALSARLALEVLLRRGDLDHVVGFARSSPISDHMKLMVGAALGESRRLAEAHSFVDDVDVPEKDAVLGYLQILDGDAQRAVQTLRSALRQTPDDADSALNLSIALWSLGSRRKAIAAALQAVRAAPGREDVFVHYLELLLTDGEFERVDGEIELFLDQRNAASARVLIARARSKLSNGNVPDGIRLLDEAFVAARAEGDEEAAVEVQSNLLRIRAQHGKIPRDDALWRLSTMHREHPTETVIVANLAQVASRKHHAPMVREVFESVRSLCEPSREAFVDYVLATLEGSNERAAEFARLWLSHDPNSRYAASAAMVAIGIGEERWAEAADIARLATVSPRNRDIVNNSAYILAMAGEADSAVALLEPVADQDFVLRATLGLACLAAGDIQRGMKLYREAGREAERQNDYESCSLMTEHQALVVRQLGLLDSNEPGMLAAVSLPPVPLPDDWADIPAFLRLRAVAARHGYPWPLSS